MSQEPENTKPSRNDLAARLVAKHGRNPDTATTPTPEELARRARFNRIKQWAADQPNPQEKRKPRTASIGIVDRVMAEENAKKNTANTIRLIQETSDNFSTALLKELGDKEVDLNGPFTSEAQHALTKALGELEKNFLIPENNKFVADFVNCLDRCLHGLASHTGSLHGASPETTPIQARLTEEIERLTGAHILTFRPSNHNNQAR